MRLLPAALAAGLSCASLAYADPPPASVDQLTLPKGKLVIDAFLEINLSKSVAFKPVSLSPDIWYGVNDDLTLGLVHSSIGASGFVGGVGDSLCITGKSNGCESFYRDVGLDARYRLKGDWAIDGGLYFQDFDPLFLGLKLGISRRWRFDKLAVELQPSIYFGFTHRSDGNKESLAIPVTVAYAVAPKVELAAQTGLQMPFSHAGDFYRIPLSLGARFAAGQQLSIGLAFSLPLLITGADGGGADARTITIGVSYAH